LFLKKPERIEALGAVLLMALMIWNLIEHTLRCTLKKAGVLFQDGITNRHGVQLLS
jgi:transposase